MFTILTH